MEVLTDEAEAAVEADHGWFRGRRKPFAKLIGDLALRRDDAIRFCAEQALGIVGKGNAGALPFDDCRFATVLASDVIEHVERDDFALAEIARLLKPGAAALGLVRQPESADRTPSPFQSGHRE